jgi:hypothetical protein
MSFRLRVVRTNENKQHNIVIISRSRLLTEAEQTRQFQNEVKYFFCMKIKKPGLPRLLFMENQKVIFISSLLFD